MEIVGHLYSLPTLPMLHLAVKTVLFSECILRNVFSRAEHFAAVFEDAVEAVVVNAK
jgi:hypothetical protein